MRSHELWRWDAVELAHAIRTRKISSREAVDSTLARVASVNPRINAIVDLMADDALVAATKADAAVRNGETLGPLHGVPVTAKINVDFAGRATTNGVIAFKDNLAKEDSPPVRNWRNAGAIFIGRTNVPAFSARYFTDNALHGRTLNPWDKDRTPGGSSGGGAAAVATGMGALAHGNDRAGSIRYPAYACGVFGLRPTLGRVPTLEPSVPDAIAMTTQLTNVQGPLARSIRDLRLGLSAMADGDPRDPWWVPVPFTGKAPPPGRIAVCTGLPGSSVDPPVSAAVRQAAQWLADAGYKVEDTSPPYLQEAGDIFFTLIASEGVVSKEDRAGTSKAIEALGDEAVKRARRSIVASVKPLNYEGYIDAFARRAAILRQWMLFFERYQFLVLPTSWRLPFPVDLDQQGDAVMAGLLKSQQPMLVASILGLPGLAAPTGNADRVPVGVQLISGRFQEELLLAAGEVIEARQPPALPIDPKF
jgi:amidase